MKKSFYEKRSYRSLFKGENLSFFNICVYETDLTIGISEARIRENNQAEDNQVKDSKVKDSQTNDSQTKGSQAKNSAGKELVQEDLLKTTQNLVRKYRQYIEDYIRIHPEFLTSLEPIIPKSGAAIIVNRMCEAAMKAGVGPMAAVAGAIGQMVGQELLKYYEEVIIENGGDIFIKTNSVRKVGVYAGKSPLSEKIAIKIQPHHTPAGVCTSSGTVGHSLSFGKADAAVIISRDAFLADAAATAVCNRVKCPADIEKALKFASEIEGVDGALIIIDDKMGAWGDIEITGF
ncbi:MAG TPA: UPF0280 family protein [Clostridiales bacterium]|nr:UPF0280 family protein [Clostridiales bacterium]